jgi:hypothetical protein
MTVDDNSHEEITKNDLLAAEFLTRFRELVTMLPSLTGTLSMSDDFVRSHVNLSYDFLRASVNAATQLDDVRSAAQLDLYEAQDTLDFNRNFDRVADEVEIFVKLLRRAMARRKAKLAAQSLQVYEIAKAVRRNNEDRPLIQEIGIMKSHLNRGRKKRRKTGEGEAG